MSFGFHYHKVLREGDAPELARRHAHARALKEGVKAKLERRRRSAIGDRIKALRPTWRPRTSRPLLLTADAQELTQSVCRLGDGSMGRIAIVRKSTEEWVAVCVKA